MDKDSNAILAEEVERINVERDTNLTVEGVLESWGKKDTKVVVWSLGRGLLLAMLGLIAALAILAGTSPEVGGAGGRALLLTIGVIAIVGFFFVFRAEVRAQFQEHRYFKNVNEVARRVEARRAARDQGRTY